MPISRKSIREIRLEERVRGFSDCLELFEEAFRRRFFETNGRGRDGAVTFMWDVIRQAQQTLQPLDREWKKLWESRVDASTE